MQSPQPSAWQTERSKKSQGHYHHRGAVTAFMEAIFPAPPPIPTHALALANGTDANFMKADEAFLLFLPLLFACPPPTPVKRPSEAWQRAAWRTAAPSQQNREPPPDLPAAHGYESAEPSREKLLS